MKIPVSDAEKLWSKAPFVAVVVYLMCAALLGLPGPGLNNDEAVFFNGAVQVLNSGQEPTFAHDPWSWETIFGRRWPLMVLPYSGSVRSYLALIPFGLFGANDYSARSVTLLVGAFALFGFSILLRSRLDPKTAAAASLILAIHPAYVTQTLYDQGGVAEWMAPFGALSLALAAYLRSPDVKRMFWLGAAIGFAGWSRANLIWLLGGAAVACLIVFRKQVWPGWNQVLAMCAGAIFGGAPLLWYEIRSRGATFAFLGSTTNPQPMLSLVGHRLTLLSQTFLSDSEHRGMWDGPTLPLWQPVVFSGLVLCGLLCNLVPKSRPEGRDAAFGRATAWTFIFLLSCLLFSRLNVSDHHLIALIPLASVLVTIAAYDASRRWLFLRHVMKGLAVLYLACAMYWNVAAARQIRATGGVRLWSNAIDDVAGYLLANSPGRPVKILDWGFQHNLFVLSNSRIASTELFWGASTERSGLGRSWRDEISPGDVFVLHVSEMVLFPEATEGFQKELAISGRSVKRTRFYEKSGRPYAEVVQVLLQSTLG